MIAENGRFPAKTGALDSLHFTVSVKLRHQYGILGGKSQTSLAYIARHMGADFDTFLSEECVMPMEIVTE